MFGLVEDFILAFLNYFFGYFRPHGDWTRFIFLPVGYDFRLRESRLFVYCIDSPSDQSDESSQNQNNTETDIAQITNATLDDLFVIYTRFLMMTASYKWHEVFSPFLVQRSYLSGPGVSGQPKLAGL